MKLRCIIVDDEEGSHYVLKRYVAMTDYAVIDAAFYNVMDAAAYLKNHTADVILLDVNMPEQDGFALLDQLESEAVVIFTTAYSHFALKAFEYNAIDYLHKPIHLERFEVAMEKAKRWCDVLTHIQEPEQIHIRSNGRLMSLKTTEIIYIESLGNYIRIHTPVKSYMALMTLSEVQEALPAKKFIQVHKSNIVNLDFITATTGTEVCLSEKKLPIGRTYKQYFLSSLKNNSL